MVRIGFMYPEAEPTSPANWSGTPRGLSGGFEQAGAELVPIGVVLPPGFREAVAALSRITGKRGAVAERSAVRVTSRNLAFRRAIAAAGHLDALVALGTDTFDLAAVAPVGVPLATYDDATLAQQWHNPDSDIRNSGFSEAEVQRWFQIQAASSRAADICAVSTNWAGRSFVSDYGVDPTRVIPVGMGHRPRSGGKENRDWSVSRFLFVGVDWKRKNGDAVIRAFMRLRERVPDARLHLVGQHPQIDAPGVTDHGLLRREDPQAQAILDELFASATAFVLPSRFDPSPIAYLEAASAGLPVIATTEGGAGELLGEAAISVHPDDDEALLAAMLRLSDPQVAAQLGEMASTRSALSSWSHVAGRILGALEMAPTSRN